MTQAAVLRRIVASTCATLGALILACDVAPPTKTLPGGYQLTRMEGSEYFVHQNGVVETGGEGPLGGEIDQIGWNDSYIVARRSSPGMGQNGVGWMIVDLTSRTIAGPLTDKELAARRTVNRDLASIAVEPVGEAFERN